MKYIERYSKVSSWKTQYHELILDPKSVILYGPYARGEFTKDSDVDIMILLDLTDMEIKSYRHDLSGVTFDFNMDYDIDII